MSRIRTVKPDFWGASKTARVSRDARLLFIGLLNESDDEGRQLGSPRRLAGALFPHDDDVSTALIRRWLDELERAGFVQRYEVEGVAYLLICGFTKHQAINRPSASRLPAPLEPSSTPHPCLMEPSRPEVEVDLGSGTGNREVIAPAGAKRDLLWEAVLEACGVGNEITNGARGGYNKAVADIRNTGGTADDVPARAAMHRLHWPQIKLTPHSLAKHWAECIPVAENLTGRRTPAGTNTLVRLQERGR